MTRTQMFLVFFSVVIVVYGSLNTYIYIRGMQTFSPNSPYRTWFTVLFWFVASAFILGRLLEYFSFSNAAVGLIWIGSFWLGAMAYTFLFLVLIDIVRLVNHFLPFFPNVILQDVLRTKQITAWIVLGAVFCTIVGARINAMMPRVQNLELSIQKKSSLKELHVVMVSDIHLGTIICNSHLLRIVNTINSLNPDIVLFAGDMVDEDIEPVIRGNLGETLRQIKSTYGIYGITGNHEYIGGVEPACRYLTDHGVTLLRDSTVTVAGAFVIIGREDISIRQFSGKNRRPLADLIAAADTSLPLILMDHQPGALNDAVRNNIDLQLSGHTHHGQLWPFNYISRAVYELSWGYLQKGNTHFYVSCGVGTWGPPMRTGNRPEVVDIKLKFEGADNVR